MKAISEKILENFATKEFLLENILDFQFVTSNRTKEELIWKIVRNTTVLNRFIPFYTKELYKNEIIFLCNELMIKTKGRSVDYLKKQIFKKWNSDNPEILHHELIGKFSDKEFLRDYLGDYVFATTGKKEFLIAIVTENLELHEFVLKRLFDELETEQLSAICIDLEENRKDLFEFSSLTNAGIMRKELSEQWNKTIFEIDEKNVGEKASGLIEKLREIKAGLDEAWQETGTTQTIDFEKLRELKNELSDNLKENVNEVYKKIESKIEEKISPSIKIAKSIETLRKLGDKIGMENSDNTFSFFQDSIEEMNVNQANYQPVMIKTLLLNGGKCSKDRIVKALFDYNHNMNKELRYFREVPVFGILIGKSMVVEENNEYELIGGYENGYRQVIDSMPTHEINKLIHLCDEKIKEAESYITIPELDGVFDFPDKNFFMINGPWVNWSHSLNNRVDGKDVLWATRGADPVDIGIFNRLRIGDLVFFSNMAKDTGPFSRKVIFGFGQATKKFVGEKPYWPDEIKENTVIYKYRFAIKPIFETYDEIEAIRWISGLPYTKGFNSIADSKTKSLLNKEIFEKWKINKKSLEKTQEELDEEFYKDKNFEKNKSKILEEQSKIVDETEVHPDQLNSEFSAWEEKIFRKIVENNVLFETKPWGYPLSEYETYTPDAELSGLCLCGRKVVVEAHEIFSEDDAKKYAAFVLQYYQSRYLILIVPDEQKKIWDLYQQQNKIVSYRELWSETEAEEKIEAIYQVSDRYAISKLPQYAICPQCQIEAENQNQVFEIFGPRKRKNGQIIAQSRCKQCR